MRGGDCFFVQAELGKMIYSDICLFLQGTKITSLTADIDVVEKKALLSQSQSQLQGSNDQPHILQRLKPVCSVLL